MSLRSEKALQESEERFRYITDLSPALVWVSDASKACTWFNKTWLDFTGRSMAQETGDGWAEGVHPDDIGHCLAVYVSHFDRRRPFSMEYRLRRRDGEYRWMLDAGQPRFDDSGAFQGYVGSCLDITERKQAEMEREQFMTFFMLSLDVMCIVGANGDFRKVNPAFTKVLGYSEEELLARPFAGFIVAEDRQTMEEDVARQWQGGLTLNFENRFRCKDGTIRLLSWKTIVDVKNQVRYATARDITGQMAAEGQLRKLWQAVEQSPTSIVVTDLDARIEYVNQAFEKVSGYRFGDVQGQNPRVLQSGETPVATYEQLWAALARGDTWEGEFINKRRNGEVYVEFARISPIRQANGRITHYLAIKEDITERKRSEDAIRASRMLLQCVIDSTPDWIYVKDSEHRFILVNQSVAKAFNQTPEHMLGRYDTDFFPQEMQRGNTGGRRSLHGDDDAVFSGRSIHKHHDKVVLGNGETRIFDTISEPLRDPLQKVYGNLTYRRDITERWRTEQDQRVLEKQLRQAQKMELIGHLTGGIAHDFNNILAAMFGYAELAQMMPELKQNPQLSRYLQEILQAGLRAKELVSQLLTFSRRKEAVTEPIVVAPIVKEVTTLLRSIMPATISIKASVAQGLPEVLISAVNLHQILMNLGVNARDAIEDKGTVDIKAERVFLEGLNACDSCHLDFSGRFVMISVKDSGSGIQPEYLPKIFDPFFTTKEVGGGSGLGLSVLHGIVHSANGHIEVRTALGEGTEFRVYLPAQSSEAGRSARDVKPSAENSPARGHILVVDDEPSIVGFMTTLLQDLGCTVTGLTSGTEALRLFEADPQSVDMVIADQTMPDMTGADLARAMLARRPDLPVVLNTGYSNAIDEETARQIGVRRFLMKPVPSKLLCDVVVECLAEKPRCP